MEKEETHALHTLRLVTRSLISATISTDIIDRHHMPFDRMRYSSSSAKVVAGSGSLKAGRRSNIVRTGYEKQSSLKRKSSFSEVTE